MFCFEAGALLCYISGIEFLAASKPPHNLLAECQDFQIQLFRKKFTVVAQDTPVTLHLWSPGMMTQTILREDTMPTLVTYYNNQMNGLML